MTASPAAGCPTQLAWRAAQAGTWMGLGRLVGLGLGLASSVGLGLGLGLGLGVCFLAVGVFGGARGPLAVQPVSAASVRRRTTPFLTALSTNKGMAALRAFGWRASCAEYREGV
jgi:hypothetical protein